MKFRLKNSELRSLAKLPPRMIPQTTLIEYMKSQQTKKALPRNPLSMNIQLMSSLWTKSVMKFPLTMRG